MIYSKNKIIDQEYGVEAVKNFYKHTSLLLTFSIQKSIICYLICCRYIIKSFEISDGPTIHCHDNRYSGSFAAVSFIRVRSSSTVFEAMLSCSTACLIVSLVKSPFGVIHPQRQHISCWNISPRSSLQSRVFRFSWS